MTRRSTHTRDTEPAWRQERGRLESERARADALRREVQARLALESPASSPADSGVATVVEVIEYPCLPGVRAYRLVMDRLFKGQAIRWAWADGALWPDLRVSDRVSLEGRDDGRMVVATRIRGFERPGRKCGTMRLGTPRYHDPDAIEFELFALKHAA